MVPLKCDPLWWYRWPPLAQGLYIHLYNYAFIVTDQYIAFGLDLNNIDIILYKMQDDNIINLLFNKEHHTWIVSVTHLAHRKSYLVIICPNAHDKLTKIEIR